MRLIDLQKSKLPKSTTKVTSNRQTDFFLPQIQTQSQNILGNIYLNSNITFSAECLLTQYHAQWLFYSIRVRLVGGNSTTRARTPLLACFVFGGVNHLEQIINSALVPLYKEITFFFDNNFLILIRMPKSFLVKHKNICAFYDREAMETNQSAFQLVMPSSLNRKF